LLFITTARVLPKGHARAKWHLPFVPGSELIGYAAGDTEASLDITNAARNAKKVPRGQADAAQEVDDQVKASVIAAAVATALALSGNEAAAGGGGGEDEDRVEGREEDTDAGEVSAILRTLVQLRH
jgi:hypothetical protein